MKAVTKFYNNSKEVDVMASVQATIQASSEPFTAEEMFEVLSSANPNDEYLDERSVSRAVRGLTTIEANVATDLGNGQYVRK